MIESVKKSRITPKGDDPGKYILDLTGEYIEPEIERTMATFMARALTDAVKMETKRVAELYIEANFPDLIKGVKPETVTNLALYYASQVLALKLTPAQWPENEGYCWNCRIGYRKAANSDVMDIAFELCEKHKPLLPTIMARFKAMPVSTRTGVWESQTPAEEGK